MTHTRAAVSLRRVQDAALDASLVADDALPALALVSGLESVRRATSGETAASPFAASLLSVTVLAALQRRRDD